MHNALRRGDVGLKNKIRKETSQGAYARDGYTCGLSVATLFRTNRRWPILEPYVSWVLGPENNSHNARLRTVAPKNQ